MRSFTVLVITAALALAGCGTGRDAVDTDPAEKRYVDGGNTSLTFSKGERPAAPKVTGTLLDGGSFDLADHRGKVVVINYWASWCAPCRLEAAELEKVYAETKADGVVFIGVNIRDDKDKAGAFNERFGVSYPSLFDPAGRVALRFRDAPPTTIPTTILIDRDGRIASVLRKAVLYDELKPAVTKLAAEK